MKPYTLHEVGKFWVTETKDSYTVYETGLTHSVPLCSFERNSDGLSLAIAYADYKAKRVMA